MKNFKMSEIATQLIKFLILVILIAALTLLSILASKNATCVVWIAVFGNFLTFAAFLFSIWLYFNNDFKQKTNFLYENISYWQNKISLKYLLYILDKIYSPSGVNFQHSVEISKTLVNYNVIKYVFELLSLIDKRWVNKKFSIYTFKNSLSNETLWICSLYALENKEFKRLWKKYVMQEEMVLFHKFYCIDELIEKNDDELNKIDDRIFAYEDWYKEILEEMIRLLNKE